MTASDRQAIELTFDASVLDPDLGARLNEELRPGLEGAGLQLVAPGSTGWELRARVISFDADERNYQVELTVRDPSGASSSRTVDCEACSERRLVGMVVDLAPTLIAEHEPAELDVELPPEDEDVGEEVEFEAEPVDRKRFERIGPMGFSGAALAVVGLGSCFAGTYWLGLGVDGSPGWADLSAPTRDYRPVGIAALGAGGVALSAGVALLIVDLRRRAPNRSVTTEIGRGYVGLTFHQRF